jgi:hypothetical protein
MKMKPALKESVQNMQQKINELTQQLVTIPPHAEPINKATSSLNPKLGFWQSAVEIKQESDPQKVSILEDQNQNGEQTFMLTIIRT